MPDALKNYSERCIALLGAQALAGKRIGVYQHSSVARDLIVSILQELGADAVALGRSDVFVPVDTEALRPEDVAFADAAARKYKLDALVSTDGDADRPLVADENGVFLRGDSLGLLTARFLNADAVVTPVTSNTAIELSGLFAKVYRTRVGSPYVIEGMEQAVKDGYRRVVGFEANGGVLLGSSVTTDRGQVEALPTRDAMLPILSVLGMAARDGVALSKLLDGLPSRFTRSGRIEHVSAERSGPFLQSLRDDDATRAGFFAALAQSRTVTPSMVSGSSCQPAKWSTIAHPAMRLNCVAMRKQPATSARNSCLNGDLDKLKRRWGRTTHEDHSDNHERRRRCPPVARFARDASETLHQACRRQEPASTRVRAGGCPAGRRADRDHHQSRALLQDRGRVSRNHCIRHEMHLPSGADGPGHRRRYGDCGASRPAGLW